MFVVYVDSAYVILVYVESAYVLVYVDSANVFGICVGCICFWYMCRLHMFFAKSTTAEKFDWCFDSSAFVHL